jgi:hypothetical protein
MGVWERCGDGMVLGASVGGRRVAMTSFWKFLCRRLGDQFELYIYRTMEFYDMETREYLIHRLTGNYDYQNHSPSRPAQESSNAATTVICQWIMPTYLSRSFENKS